METTQIRGQYGSFTEKPPVTGWDIVKPAAVLYGVAFGAVAAEAAFVDIGWGGVSSVWNWGKNLLFPACADGDCTNEIEGVGDLLQRAEQPTIDFLESQESRINHIMNPYTQSGYRAGHDWVQSGIIEDTGNLVKNYQALQPNLRQVVDMNNVSPYLNVPNNNIYTGAINDVSIQVVLREVPNSVPQIVDAWMVK